jgi:hypothetical protein
MPSFYSPIVNYDSERSANLHTADEDSYHGPEDSPSSIISIPLTSCANLFFHSCDVSCFLCTSRRNRRKQTFHRKWSLQSLLALLFFLSLILLTLKGTSASEILKATDENEIENTYQNENKNGNENGNGGHGKPWISAAINVSAENKNEMKHSVDAMTSSGR